MNADWLWDKKIPEAEAKKTLKKPESKDFIALAALLLARKNNPNEIFKGYINPLVFCRQWAIIKKRMRQDKWAELRIVFWQAIYENLAEKYRRKGVSFRKEQSGVKEPLCHATGVKINELRREQGLSQKQLAKKIGVSQQVISRIEKGGENASLITLAKIAQALNKKIHIEFVR